MKHLLCFWAATALTGIACASPISNFSFESPVTASFIYDPSNPGGWTFVGNTGVASNTFFVAPPPDGSQAGFIQGFNAGTTQSAISQTLGGVVLAPSTLSFFLAQRPGGFAADPIEVLYGSQNLGSFSPSSTTFQQVNISFTPTATSGLLVFRSLAPTTSDIDTAIDNVSLTAVGSVPEPATFGLVGVVLLGVGLLRKRLA